MIAKEQKNQLVDTFKQHPTDTGSVEVQVALLTERIQQTIGGHLKTHAKDYSSRRGQIILVGQRRRLLAYLKRHDVDRYEALIARLNLRK
jgi:small subunit ribosomal protein S15